MTAADPFPGRMDVAGAALVSRVQTGSLSCQRMVLGVLQGAFFDDAITPQHLVEHGEPYARAAAGQGSHKDWLFLAGLLAVKNTSLREAEDFYGADRAAGEVALILARLIGAGHDDLVEPYLMFRSLLSPDERDALANELWVDGLEVEQKPEPEVMAAMAARLGSPGHE